MLHRFFASAHARSFLAAFAFVLYLFLAACGGGGGGGGGGGSGSGGTPLGTQPRYAFAANFKDNSISTYVVDPSAGRLKWIGKVVTANGPSYVTFSPSGKFVYAVSQLGNEINAFSLGADGTLTPISCGTPGTTGCTGTVEPTGFSAGSGPKAMAIDPSGKYAYVPDVSSDSQEFQVGADGKLTLIGTFSPGLSTSGIAIDPAGKHVYVANFGNQDVAAYTIGSDGTLTQILCQTSCSGASGGKNYTAGAEPWSVAVSPDNKFAFVVNTFSGDVSAFSIASDGSLSQVDCSTTAAPACNGKNFPTGTTPRYLALDPSGKYLYVANGGSGTVVSTVSQFSIGGDGSLMPIGGGTVATGADPWGVTVDPSGKYVYVANFYDGTDGNSVSQYSIGSNGSLTPLLPAIAPAFTQPLFVAVSRGTALQAVPKYAYVENRGGGVSQFTIGTDGSLAPLNRSGAGDNLVPAGATPSWVAVAPSGKYAYVPNWGNQTAASTVSQYDIGSDGRLTAMTPSATAPADVLPFSATVSPLGRYVYVANINSNDVSQYTVNTDGSLAPMGTPTVAAGTGPVSVGVDPTGRYVYVANGTSGDVSAYSVGSAGALTQISCGTVGTTGCNGTAEPTNFVAGPSPNYVTVDPSDKYVYVVNAGTTTGGNSVSQFSINADGSLSPLATPAVGRNPQCVAIDSTDRHAYVVDWQDVAVSQFTIGTDGSFTPLVPIGAADNQVAVGSGPISVAIDPSNRYAYVTSQSVGVLQYTIGTDGSLSPLIPSGATDNTVAAGTGSSFITTLGTWR